MKLFKSRKLSIILALVLVLTSFSFTAMAAEGDAAPAADLAIISAAKNLGSVTNAQKDLPADYQIVTEKDYVDPITGRTVVKYSATTYGAPSGAYDTPGSEPRIKLGTLFGKADFENNKDTYGYTKISFDIYIKNKADGLGFRLQRYSTADDALGNQCYIGVGGSDFRAGGGSNTTDYINTDLKVEEWNNVVIELGTNTTNKDVVFHINGVSTVCETKLPDDTYGFGGNENRCILIPKSNKDVPFEIRLDNFSIVLTNTKPDFHIFNNEYFVSGTFIDRSGALTREQVNAKEFSESYNKKALNLKNTSTTTGLTGGPGQEAGFKLNSVPGATANKNDQQSLGGLDWSKYKNLRIQFNAYFGYENIIFFRTVRSVDGSFDSTNNNHVIGVGTPADPNGAKTGTANTGTANCTYRYREMTPNMWHNVVMELGANKDNKYINIYIDGKKVTSSELATEFTNGDTAEGFGTVGASRLVLAIRDTTDSLLDVQISDISFTACDTIYNPAAAPSIEGVPSEGLTYRVDTDAKAITYVADRDADGMSVADFKVSNVDYLAPTDSTNTKVIAYNAGSKRVAYYTLAEQTGVIIDEVDAEVKDGRVYVKFDIYNQTDESVSYKLHIACYDSNGALTHVRANTWCPVPVGLSAQSYDLNLPTTVDYDTVKVFLWSSAEKGSPVVIPMLKAAEIEVE